MKGKQAMKQEISERKQLERLCYLPVDHLSDEEIHVILTRDYDIPMHFDKLREDHRPEFPSESK